MEFRPKSTFEHRTSRNNMTYRRFNKFNIDNRNQSPKIFTNRMRYLPFQHKLYSLNDINDKLTNSKGPKLAKQYKRLTDKELNKYYNNDKLTGWNYDKLFINKYFKMIKSTKNSINSKQMINLSDNNEINTNIEKSNQINISNNDKNKSLKRPSTEKENIRDKNIQKIIPATKRNDIWMPKNFKNYDLLVKNPKMLKIKSSQEEMLNRIPSFSYQEIRKKMKDTDIFFTKSKTIQKDSNKRVKSSYIFSESDVFNKKNDKVNLSKSGEIYLFKPICSKKYTSINESNSFWKAGNNYPNLINHPSTNFNILSPNVKNNQFNKTKQKIFEECKNKIINKDNITEGLQKKFIFFNPTHKQKGIAEFNDITRNGSGNPGKDFIKNYKDNPFCFQKNSNVCANFGDTYYNYQNVSTRPFMKERFEK